MLRRLVIQIHHRHPQLLPNHLSIRLVPRIGSQPLNPHKCIILLHPRRPHRPLPKLLQVLLASQYIPFSPPMYAPRYLIHSLSFRYLRPLPPLLRRIAPQHHNTIQRSRRLHRPRLCYLLDMAMAVAEEMPQYISIHTRDKDRRVQTYSGDLTSFNRSHLQDQCHYHNRSRCHALLTPIHPFILLHTPLRLKPNLGRR